MGEGCKHINWDKPVQGTNEYHHPVRVLMEMENGDRLIEWNNNAGKKCQAIVDSRGHGKWTDYGTGNGYHLVENMLEEKREWFVFVKNRYNGQWDYLRCGAQPYTSSYADECIRRHVKSLKSDYSDFVKIEADPNMVNNFTIPND